MPTNEPRTVSAACAKEMLGEDFSFLIAYNKDGDPTLFVPEGGEVKSLPFPFEFPPRELLNMSSVATIKAAGKCVVYINGKPYCYTC